MFCQKGSARAISEEDYPGKIFGAGRGEASNVTSDDLCRRAHRSLITTGDHGASRLAE